MDRADAEIVEEEDVMTMKSSWSGAVLRRCWWIGKSVAFAGAAITSAPFIVPPLFVLTTLGIAFSFPSGIYLAGYVCTEKVMSVLLPLPPEVDEESLESEDLIERGFDADEGDEMVRDEDKWDKVEALHGKREVGDFLGQEVREDVTAAPESSGSPKSPYTVVVMAANEERSKKAYEPPNLSSEHLSIVERRGEGMANEALVAEELREDGRKHENGHRVANGVVAKDKELSEEFRTEVPRLKSDHVFSAVIVPSKVEDAGNLQNVASMEHIRLGKPVPAAEVAIGVTGLHSHEDISSLQRTHNEEELWDQISSIRAIVGYKETLQPSLSEELLALYELIGVEPPIFLKDSTDLAELCYSLQFLKSVVGVN